MALANPNVIDSMRIFQHIVLCPIVIALASVSGCGPIAFIVGVSPANQKLTATIVEPSGKWFSPRVVLVDISGMLYTGNKRGLLTRGENPVSLLDEKLRKAGADPDVKAIILRLNTPGGTVGASETMYEMIHRFKTETGKPVVALMTDVAASGGYYIACSADRIIANPTTITGSIGVIVQTMSFKSALTRIGIMTESIASGSNKDAGSPLSTLTDEHRKIIRGMVSDFYEQFIEVVRRARPDIPAEDFDRVTDGRVVTGREAHRLGLADEIGDLYLALDEAKRLAGIGQADLVVYHRPMTYIGSPYTSSVTDLPNSMGPASQINLMQLNFPEGLARPSVGFYYLWTLP